MASAALFLDRDGVINVDHGYVHRVEDFEFMPGIFDLVRMARDLAYKVIVVTNQAGIGRGYYTEEQFHALMQWMRQRFEEAGGSIDAVYFCPFHPEHGVGRYRQESEFRKPGPGMLRQAAQELNLDLSRSVMIGDKDSDMVAAHAAGVGRRVLLGSQPSSSMTESIANLSEAIEILISLQRRSSSQSSAQTLSDGIYRFH